MVRVKKMWVDGLGARARARHRFIPVLPGNVVWDHVLYKVVCHTVVLCFPLQVMGALNTAALKSV